MYIFRKELAIVTLVSIKRARPKINIVPYLFLIVPLFLFLMWVIGPMIYSFYLSLTNWDGISAPQFVGIANYIRLFKDRVFYTAIGNNLKWIVSFVTIPVIMGLVLAMALNSKIFGARVIKAAFFMPYILSFVVIGLIFGWMYHPAGGLLNSILKAIGLGWLTSGWLADPKLATWCIIAAALWRQVGYVMILYLAGLQAIDASLVDAAKVDGSNNWQLFRHVILPQLSPVTAIVIIISIIDSLRSFDAVFIMTRGGPAGSTTVLAYFMYNEAFNNYNMGYGAAIAVCMFFITAIVIFIYLWRIIHTEIEY